MVEDIKPIPDDSYPPIIEGSDVELREICYKSQTNLWRPNTRNSSKRLDRELNSIISNGYAVMYIIAQNWLQNLFQMDI